MIKATAWNAECSANCKDPNCPYTHPPKRVTTLDILNKQGEVVAALEVEGGKATPSEMEKHYTHFANLFMTHLGRNLKAICRKPANREFGRY